MKNNITNNMTIIKINLYVITAISGYYIGQLFCPLT